MDVKKIISWLEGLSQDDWREFHSDSEVQNIAKSALELLKEQSEMIERYNYEAKVTEQSMMLLVKERPKIVRCRDCKHYDEQCQQCERIDGIILPDFFCADGEMKPQK